jgi:hypothetical protein
MYWFRCVYIYRLDTTRNPLNVVSQVSEHQQKAIFAQAAPNPHRTSVRTFNTQDAADQESEQREMEKRCTRQSCQEHGSIWQ